MRTLWTVLLVLTVCAAAFAVPLQPFFGVNLNANFPQAEFAGKDFIYNQGGAKTGSGWELDAGLNWPEIQVYAGYQEGSHAADWESVAVIRTQPYLETMTISAKGDWTIKRMVIGGRIPLSKGKIAPVLGAAVTIGKTKFDPTITYDNRQWMITSQSSTSTGMLIEGGLRVRIKDKATLLALVQYQKFDADFAISIPENDLYGGIYNPSFAVSYVGLRLGFTYQL